MEMSHRACRISSPPFHVAKFDDMRGSTTRCPNDNDKNDYETAKIFIDPYLDDELFPDKYRT